MSTRSRIGILNQDGTVESVYCHQDGYPEYTGYFLENFYSNINAVKNLLSKGDISNISCKYDWNNQKKYFENKIVRSIKTFAQRGEKTESVIHENVIEYLKFDSDDRFKYLFSNGEKEYSNAYLWICFDMSKLNKNSRPNDLFIDIPKSSRYFDLQKEVINPLDFVHLEQGDTVESLGNKIMQMGL